MWDNIAASALVCGVLIIVFWLFTTIIRQRQIKKSKQYFLELEQQIKVGVKVILINGIVGKIVKIDNDFINVLVAPNVTISCIRYSVKQIIN